MAWGYVFVAGLLEIESISLVETNGETKMDNAKKTWRDN